MNASKASNWLKRGLGEGNGGTESGISWNWQGPRPFYTSRLSPSHQSSSKDYQTTFTSRYPVVDRNLSPPPESSDDESQDSARGPGFGRPLGGVHSNCITKTTRYDAETGGYITEVSTDTTDPLLPVVNSSPVDKLILSQESYNTLTRDKKRKISHQDMGAERETNFPSAARYLQPVQTMDRLARRDSGLSLSGSLVSQSPVFVTSIAVVNTSGSLITLASLRSEDSETSSSSDNCQKIGKVEALNNNVGDRRIPSHNRMLLRNADFVTNIQLGSLSLDRAKGKEKIATDKQIPRQNADSLISSSLLDLTRPRQEFRSHKTKLSSYVLDQDRKEREPSFGPEETIEEDDFAISNNKLSATVLDKGDDLSNLCKTISRKQILNKVQCSNFHMHDETKEGEGRNPHQEDCHRKHSNMFGGRGRTVPSNREETSATKKNSGTGSRPLTKIIERLHAVQTAENTYVSMTSDSLYQSLQHQQQSPPDDNNNSNDGQEQDPSGKYRGDPIKMVSACPVLISNLAASHVETSRHATLSGCMDCCDYATSLGYALPRLEPRVYQPQYPAGGGPCNVHGYTPHGTLSTLERGMMEKAHARHGGGGRVDTRRESRVVCYLAAVILAILVLIAVIVILTMMVAHNEMDF